MLFFTLYLASLSAAALGQFFGGAHPLTATFGAPFGAGESETLPISQEELAQLMAQSLATSGQGNYGSPKQAPQQPKKEEDDFGSNFDSEDDDDDKEGPAAPPAPQPHEPQGYSNEGQQEYGPPAGDGNEGAPYQPAGGDGSSEGDSGDSGDSNYQEQPQYQDNPNGYDHSAPNYQQEQGGDQHQDGQYPESGHYSDNGNQEPQSQGYGGYRGQSESNEPGYRAYDNAVNQETPQYSAPNSYNYVSPGSGYSGPGSESLRSYSVRGAPKSYRYRS